MVDAGAVALTTDQGAAASDGMGQEVVASATAPVVSAVGVAARVEGSDLVAVTDTVDRHLAPETMSAAITLAVVIATVRVARADPMTVQDPHRAVADFKLFPSPLR